MLNLKDNLEVEIKVFIYSLPYWAKYVCSTILNNAVLSDSNIDTALSYLMDELKLIKKTEKPEIVLNYNANNLVDYKNNLVFNALQKVEGVNALSENQTLKFSHKITIMYGVNGSGKSGYVRLLKNAFYSKHQEVILQNVFKPDGHKPINAKFTFTSEGSDIHLNYPTDSTNGIFNQFAIFDGKIALKHLENRNDFEFRPAGLTLFSEFNATLEKLQQKINTEISLKPVSNPYIEIFEGQSEIKTLIDSLSSNSNLNDLKKRATFSEKDKIEKLKIDKEYDDLRIALNSKDKQIETLQRVKTQIERIEKNLSAINTYFKQSYLNSIQTLITSCVAKQAIAKKEGIENFATDKIQNIGSVEWKLFIKAAEKFALKQDNAVYPIIGDNCLFCHQPILKEQQDLISSYWTFLKSVAEKESKDAQIAIDKIKDGFKKIPFNQFPDENTLTVWLNENYPETLTTFIKSLSNQQSLSEIIISDIDSKKMSHYTSIQIELKKLPTIKTSITLDIKLFQEDDQSKALAELLKKKTYLAHMEKLELRFSDIEKLYQNMVWVNKANKFNKKYWKKRSTDTEKGLSQKYFNEKYIETFNEECGYLNGNFGIDVDAKSSDAQSNRQLFIKGKVPSLILSEGEQKVIAIADFMAESKLSTINKGIIFDDPVNSLDDDRKNIIAERLVAETKDRQVIVFTHDLAFLSSIINYCSDYEIEYKCNWVEKLDDEIGKVWLDNTPSYEKKYKKSGVAHNYLEKAKKSSPEEREALVKIGFAALRATYEAFVIFDLFEGVVQRLNDRVSIDSLSGVYVDNEIIKEIMSSYGLACRYMEGHSHSDKFLSKKPTPAQLNEEIVRFDSLKKKLKTLKKSP